MRDDIEVTFQNVEPAAPRLCGEFVRLHLKTMYADRGDSDRGTASDYFVNYPPCGSWQQSARQRDVAPRVEIRLPDQSLVAARFTRDLTTSPTDARMNGR